MNSTSNENIFYFWTIIMLLLIGGFLRVWGIQYGLPYPYHPDEPYSINLALAMGYKKDFDPHLYIHPALYSYSLVFAYGIYFLSGLVLSLWSSAEGFAIQILKDASPLYWIARCLSAFFSTLTILMIFLTAKKIMSRRAALTAAAIFTPLYLPVYFGHFAKPETLQIFLAVSAFCFLNNVWHGGRIKDYILSGLLIGLATAAKQPAVLLCLPLLIAHFFRPRIEVESNFYKKIFIGLIFVFIGFFIASPFSVINFPQVLENFKGINFYSVGPARGGNLFLVWVKDLKHDIGLPVLGVFFVSLIYIFIASFRMALFVSAFPLVHFVIFSLPGWKNVHWQAVTLPFFCFLTGWTLDNLSRRATKNIQRQNFLILGTILFLFLFSLPPVIANNKLLSRTDTRTIAKEWIEANIPSGSKIAMEKGRFSSYVGPALKENSKSIETNYLDPASDINRQGYQVKYLENYYRLLIKATDGITYEVIPLLLDPFAGQSAYYDRAALKNLEELRRMGAAYVVVSRALIKVGEGLSPAAEKYFNLYKKFREQLDDPEEAALIKEVLPENNLGPHIKIYRIKPSRSL